MKVEQLMTREIEVCKADETLNHAAQLMWERDCGFIPVIASNGDGALAGVVTDATLRWPHISKANRRSRSRYRA
jgi:CBS domain-containing protein